MRRIITEGFNVGHYILPWLSEWTLENKKTKKTKIQKQDMRPISMVCLKPVDKYSLTTQHYVTLHFWSFGWCFNHCIVTLGCDSPKGLLFLLICSQRFLFLVRLTDYAHNEWRTEVFTATPDLVWMKQIKQPDLFLQSFYFLLFQLHFFGLT